ncbi:hypothetical protein BJ912DRAFT_920511 [Pholiota molesta]|nr:hypothetical protein BJ912DRAFT_920511 [Pholiota molesta]
MAEGTAMGADGRRAARGGDPGDRRRRHVAEGRQGQRGGECGGERGANGGDHETDGARGRTGAIAVAGSSSSWRVTWHGGHRRRVVAIRGDRGVVGVTGGQCGGWWAPSSCAGVAGHARWWWTTAVVAGRGDVVCCGRRRRLRAAGMDDVAAVAAVVGVVVCGCHGRETWWVVGGVVVASRASRARNGAAVEGVVVCGCRRTTQRACDVALVACGRRRRVRVQVCGERWGWRGGEPGQRGLNDGMGGGAYLSSPRHTAGTSGAIGGDRVGGGVCRRRHVTWRGTSGAIGGDRVGGGLVAIERGRWGDVVGRRGRSVAIAVGGGGCRRHVTRRATWWWQAGVVGGYARGSAVGDRDRGGEPGQRGLNDGRGGERLTLGVGFDCGGCRKKPSDV